MSQSFRNHRRFVGPALFAVLVGASLGFSLADGPPAAPKLSEVVPAVDLTAAAESYLARVKTMLADEAAFTANKDQIAQKANALVGLLQVLGNHDGESPLKANAAAAMTSARELSRAADFAAAKTALDGLTAALAKTDAADAPKWEKTASLGKLMHEAEEVNGRIRRNLRRFERTKDDSAQAAAVLAAIAQASVYDTHEVKNPADLPKWYAMSAEMRDAAAALSKSAHAGDEAAFKSGLDRLSKSCETCHAVFHQE